MDTKLIVLGLLALFGPLSWPIFSAPAATTTEFLPTSVGGITPKSKREDVEKLFGQKNVEAYNVVVAEGETVPGTRIYPHTKQELIIEWKEDGTPLKVSTKKPDSAWKTLEGITVGTSLREVERVNGRPFKLTGFRTSYSGMVTSWEGGKISEKVGLTFSEPPVLSEGEAKQVVGHEEDPLISDHSVLLKNAEAIKVRELSVYWPVEENRKTCPSSTQGNIPDHLPGKTYHEARQSLLKAGWLPFRSKPQKLIPSQDPDLSGGNGRLFWEKGYEEIQACAGTGTAACAFLFKDKQGKLLRVVTRGEEFHGKSQAKVDAVTFLCDP